METGLKARNCGRCKGTGQARYNHLNGDTHCYLCNGTGIQVTKSKELRAREASEDQWISDAHMSLVGGFNSFENKIRRTCRELTGDRRSELRRRMIFWVDLDQALGEMSTAQHEDRRAAEAQAIEDFKVRRAA